MGSTSPSKSFPNQLTPFNQSGGGDAVTQVKPVAAIAPSDQYQVGPSLSSVIPPANPAQPATPTPDQPALADSPMQAARQLRGNRVQPFFGQY